MLEQLAQAIDEADLAVDGATLAEAYRLYDRLGARLQRCVGEFDRAGLWDLDDATSMPAWLRANAGRAPSDAARTVRVARVTAHLPITAAAAADGVLTNAQVEAIASHVGRHVERFAGDEVTLVPLLADCDLAGTLEAMRRWRAAADDADELAEPDEPNQSLHVSDVAGRGAISGDLCAETLGVLREALAVADCGDLNRFASERRADALDTVCRFFLSHHDDERPPRRRPRIALVVTPEEAASGEYGLDLCDAAVHRLVVTGRSLVVDFGRATRTISAHQRDLLGLRDRHCRWPGCDRPGSWCDGHHVREWDRDAGPTDLDNLVLLCRRHHRRLHRPGYRAKLLPDATFEITWPDGHTASTEPAGILPAPFW